MKQDNSTAKEKIALRRMALRLLGGEDPVVLETHGGYGTLFRACYRDVARGCVLEKERGKAKMLCSQRPTWAVYQGDSVAALSAGVPSHLVVNLLDLDPYGDPWPTLSAFFGSDRSFPDRLVVVVNDGLKQKIQHGGGWDVASVRPLVERYGNTFEAVYLEACQWYLAKKAGEVGYMLSRWTGYYCGFHGQMTHYLALLTKEEVRHAS